MRQFLRRFLTGLAACYLVSTWAGCKSASPYDQLEMEKRKYEQMQEEKDPKGWMRNSVATPLGSPE